MSQPNLREIIKQEYKKCIEDPIYFMKKYVKIQHPIRGTVAFELYSFQEDTLREFVDNQLNIVLKSRQMGISTLTAAYSLWLMTFHNDKNILCIGGAVSVDREWRYTKKQKLGTFENPTLGVESWWSDEVFVLDENKLKDLRDINIMVTHTCPHYCPPDNTFGLGQFVEGIIKDTGDTELRTDLLFERNQVTQAFSIVKMNNDIEFAYYGHFHRSDDITMYGTKHRLLGVGELWEERG